MMKSSIVRFRVMEPGRRGFPSLNGCVAAISMDNGKVLDVEALSKSLQEMQRIREDGRYT